MSDYTRQTIPGMFAGIAAANSGVDAVINGDTHVSYGELNELAERCAVALTASGVGQGDRVGLLSNVRLEAAVVFLACARIGAIYLGLGTRLMPADLRYVLADARPKVIFTMRHLWGRNYAGDVTEACAGVYQPRIVPLTDSGSAMTPEFRDFIAVSSDTRRIAGRINPGDGVAIIYTSGSTGLPKGAVITHQGLLISGDAYMGAAAVETVRALSMLPIDHVGFVALELIAILMRGGTLIQLPQFEPVAVLEAIEKHRASVWLAIPTMIQRLIASGRLDDYDLSSLEFLWWAGAIPASSIAAMRSKARRVAVSYGMTEAAGTITFSGPEADDVQLATSVGRVHPKLELKIDSEDPDTPGEILLRGPQLIREYWNNPPATAAAFTSEGWFRTGDLGTVRAGVLYIAGRSKETIRSGGYNIMPNEVERVIQNHPDVALSFVLGVPDAEYGEAVHAIVQMRTGCPLDESELRAYVREHLSGFKVPKRFWERPELPLLSNGKVDRKRLRTELIEKITSN